MSAQVANSNSSLEMPKSQIDINALVKENEILREANEKLYKRTLNQRRKLLRLKRQLENNSDDESSKDSEPKNITDNVWEDVEEVMASYNIDK